MVHTPPTPSRRTFHMLYLQCKFQATKYYRWTITAETSIFGKNNTQTTEIGGFHWCYGRFPAGTRHFPLLQSNLRPPILFSIPVGNVVKASHLKIGSMYITDGLSPPYPPCTIMIVITRGSNLIIHKVSEVAFRARGKKPHADKDKRHIPHCRVAMLVSCIPCMDCTLLMRCISLTDCTLPRHSVQQLAPTNHLFFTSVHFRLQSIAISICIVIYYFISSFFLFLFFYFPSLFFFQSNCFYNSAQRCKRFELIRSSRKLLTMSSLSEGLCSEGDFY